MRTPDELEHLRGLVQTGRVKPHHAGVLLEHIDEQAKDTERLDELITVMTTVINPKLRAEITRLQATVNEQAKEIRWLRVLSEGCNKHASYRAKRYVATTCETCNRMWEAHQALAPQKGADKVD